MFTSYSAMTNVLPTFDWVALAFFVVGWSAYAWFADRRATVRPSILATTNRIRHLWMLQATYREVRVFDGLVIQSLSSSPSFFASTTILIIGGLLAVFGASDKTAEFVKDVPFFARTSTLVFDLKLISLLLVFVYAFFRFTWSIRQYTFGALLVAAAPEHDVFAAGGASRQAFADRAGIVLGLAAETFNDGLRAYYFAFALIAWFVSPLAFMTATAAVVFVLYRREFESEVLGALNS